MAIDFWRVIGSNSISSRSEIEVALYEVEARLQSLDLDDLVQFQGRLNESLRLLDLAELASIPIEMPGGEVFEQTEDHFLYSRCACILAGEDVVREALEDQLSFAKFVAPRLQSAEALLYLARTEYESRTGRRMPSQK